MNTVGVQSAACHISSALAFSPSARHQYWQPPVYTLAHAQPDSLPSYAQPVSLRKGSVQFAAGECPGCSRGVFPGLQPCPAKKFFRGIVVAGLETAPQGHHPKAGHRQACVCAGSNILVQLQRPCR